MIGTGVSNGNPNDGDNYFLYNDKCSLVLVIDYEAKNEKDVYKSADKNAESNVISLLDNINCEKENELMSEELNNRIINEANSGINSKNLTDEKFEEMILSTFKKNNFGKINNSSKEHGSFKESIKLNVGLDYSNFSIDTQYKIIKFITKGSHFLYWSDDVLVGTRNDITVNKTFSSSFLEEGKKDKDSGNKGEINFYNQPYMFYSVIPKYPTNIASKKESKKYEEKEENDEAYNDKNNKKEDGVSEESNGYKNNEIDNYTKNTAYFECINIDNKYNKYIPSNLTLINLERYWILEEIIKQEYTYIYYNDEKKEAFYKYSNKLFYILGEFQFSFILFHIGFNYQSFIQWRNLFELFSNSQILVTKHADFFEKLLKVVSIHLSYLSDDFFDNKENSFILFGVYNIFDIISNIEDTHENIKSAVDSIDIIIYNKLGLHIPDLSFVYEEYQPTYVNDD